MRLCDFWCVIALWNCNSFDLNWLVELKAACTYDIKLVLDAKPATRGLQNLPEGKLAVIVVAPMLGTNLLSTSFIAWKAWCVSHPRETHLSFSSALLTDVSQGNTPSLGYATQKKQHIRARGEDSRASDRVRLRILPPLGKPRLALQCLVRTCSQLMVLRCSRFTY